jgi:hypothetical protein
MSGPDVAPLSVADAALSDLKSLARTAMPELRTPGQGIAARAVYELDEAVRARAMDAGKAAMQALEEGRAATRAKYQIAEVLKGFPREDVPLHRRLTAPKDTQIGLLRKVQEAAPGEMPNVAGRTWRTCFSEGRIVGSVTGKNSAPKRSGFCFRKKASGKPWVTSSCWRRKWPRIRLPVARR